MRHCSSIQCAGTSNKYNLYGCRSTINQALLNTRCVSKTYAAVTANISDKLALVNTANVVANKKEKAKIAPRREARVGIKFRATTASEGKSVENITVIARAIWVKYSSFIMILLDSVRLNGRRLDIISID
jgi:hypothetical protein